MAVFDRAELTEENLRQLLAQGHESEGLDFKSVCDLSINDALIELAKDIGAMQIDGGYIVIGADDHGRPTDLITEEHLRGYEQASFRAKIVKYLPEPLDIRCKHLNVDGHDYVLIFVAPSEDCFAVFRSTGNDSKQKNVFRRGDVFARHGTASEPWSQTDIPKIKRRLVDRERERWLAEATRTFAAALPSAESSAIASGPAGALSWQLDNQTFLDVVVEQLRRQDFIPLKLLLSGITSEVGEMLTDDNADQLVSIVLDRLTCLSALFLRIGQEELLYEAIQAFVAIYKLPVDSFGNERNDVALRAPLLWLMVMQRLIGVGALAERLNKWGVVRHIILQKGRGYDFEHRSNWYRHTLTMAARGDLLTLEVGGQEYRGNLLRFAQMQVDRLPCLRPDYPQDDEELLSSICRFDMLASLVGIDNAGKPTSDSFYPNFAKYQSHRTVPVVVELLEDESMRKELFRGSDEQLAEALRELDRLSRKEGGLVFGWSGYRDGTIEDFLDQHPRPS